METKENLRARQSRLSIRSLSRVVCAICAFACAVQCWANPVLPTLFSDHMVLQQGREIRVWGDADAGEKIMVSLAGENSTAAADAHGKWSTRLPALTAGGPFTLTVRGKTEINIRDVLIGEVWLASGQSNMTFSLDGSEGSSLEIPNANYPQIRLFTVPRRIALSPQENTLPAHWEICTPDNAKTFSAVAYYFAREIHRKLKVPVGVVESAWPGTTIQSWIAPEVLQADSDLRSLLAYRNNASAEQRTYAESSLPYKLEFDDFELIPAGTDSTVVAKLISARTLANFDDGSSRLSTGGSFSYSWSEAGNGAFTLTAPGRGGNGFAARVSGDLDGAKDSILGATYKFDGSPIDLTEYAGIRFWVRGNGSFRFRSKQPTITDYDDYAAPLQKATADWQQVTIWFRDLKQDGWGVVRLFTRDALTGFSIECVTTLGYSEMPASSLYDGMITPLLPFAFRGALWYQGESNAMHAYQYRELLPALIQNWRDASLQPNLDFLIVQLPNHGAIPTVPGESAWSELREAELMTIEQVPHTGLAVTIDVGDPKDLHPHRKREVGERLAIWALGTTYKQAIEYSGPLYKSMHIEGNQIRVNFTHIGAGLEVHGDQLQGFAVAGADHKFHWASAHIEGDNVVVSSAEVPSPVAVRYGWGDSPACNLFNKSDANGDGLTGGGLPASPFRTDDWAGITGGH